MELMDMAKVQVLVDGEPLGSFSGKATDASGYFAQAQALPALAKIFIGRAIASAEAVAGQSVSFRTKPRAHSARIKIKPALLHLPIEQAAAQAVGFIL